MAPEISNDLNSPVSLLWAHQLRKEHALIVNQLDEIKQLHPSATELRSLVTRTEKMEATALKIRKEFNELKAAHQRAVNALDILKKDFEKDKLKNATSAEVREAHEEDIRIELEGLNQSLARQKDHLISTTDELHQDLHRHRQDANLEQKLGQEGQEITELRRLLKVLDKKLDDAVVVVKDSIEQPAQRRDLPAREESSDIDLTDLDANVRSPRSVSELRPSLLPIKEPALRRASTELQEERFGPVEKSLRMLGEPSPTLGSKIPDQSQSSEHLQTATRLDQGKQTLTTYIQIAHSQRQDASYGQEEHFIDAFVTGLRDKRNKQKARVKLKKADKTWDNLLDCFPTASQAVRQHMEDEIQPARGVTSMTLGTRKNQAVLPQIDPRTPPREHQDEVPDRLSSLSPVQAEPSALIRPLKRIKPAGISLKDFLAQNYPGPERLEEQGKGHDNGSTSYITKTAHQYPRGPSLPAVEQGQTGQSGRLRDAAAQQYSPARPNKVRENSSTHTRLTANRMEKKKDTVSNTTTRKRPAMDVNQEDESYGLPAPNQEAAKAQQAAKRTKKVPVKARGTRAPLNPIVHSSEDDFA